MDEPIALVLLVVSLVIIGIVGLTTVFAQGQRKGKLKEAFRAIAFQYDGVVVACDEREMPSVRFMHGDVGVLLDVHAGRGEGSTVFAQMHLGWPDRSLRFEVFPERFFESLGKLMGMPDLVIGSPEFDRDYIIRGNDETQIIDLLSVDAQDKIDDLRSLLRNKDIYVGAKAGTVLIKKRGPFHEAKSLDQFVTMGLKLYDEIIGSSARGIEFVQRKESSFSLDVSSAVCQICGEETSANVVFCRSCKTPHHQDCWVYYTKCSTYGCGERKYRSTRGS